MDQKTIYALGFFDGVHLGHQALLSKCRELAEKHRCYAGAVTFSVHPATLVSADAPPLLNANHDRKSLLRNFGMRRILHLSFNQELRNTHWADFLNQLLDRGAAGFVCGDDFRFGAGGHGTTEKLAAFCEERHLPYAIVPEQVMDGKRISSTRIRKLLEQGQVAQANRLLGHPHILSGKILPGKQLGRKLGFPTANMALPAGVLTPKWGVYICKASIDGVIYSALTNIGCRPTVNGNGILAETHLLDFDQDLYEQDMTLAFCEFLRPEIKFDSLEELTAEIRKNVSQTRKFFEKSE